ncbi:MAG: hypothetical protein Q8Q09_13755 [Deltaproteobacteria bacterium]|nr:hypothetical protein [Deltaproteobacteria bacterium]
MPSSDLPRLRIETPRLSDVPTAPGESPFRVKGVAWLDTLARHGELPGGTQAVMALLPSEGLRDYYSQPFLSTSWYDVMPMIFADAAAAAVANVSFEASLHDGSRRQAHRAFAGIYRSFVRLLVPSAVAWALPRLATTYFDFGPVTTERLGAQHVRGTVSGVPAFLADWYEIAALEFVLVALEYSGCVRPKLEWSERSEAGTLQGFLLQNLTFDITWIGARIRSQD